jgi:hypothetical protein
MHRALFIENIESYRAQPPIRSHAPTRPTRLRTCSSRPPSHPQSRPPSHTRPRTRTLMTSMNTTTHRLRALSTSASAFGIMYESTNHTHYCFTNPVTSLKLAFISLYLIQPYSLTAIVMPSTRHRNIITRAMPQEITEANPVDESRTIVYARSVAWL